MYEAVSLQWTPRPHQRAHGRYGHTIIQHKKKKNKHSTCSTAPIERQPPPTDAYQTLSCKRGLKNYARGVLVLNHVSTCAHNCYCSEQAWCRTTKETLGQLHAIRTTTAKPAGTKSTIMYTRIRHKNKQKYASR